MDSENPDRTDRSNVPIPALGSICRPIRPHTHTAIRLLIPRARRRGLDRSAIGLVVWTNRTTGARVTRCRIHIDDTIKAAALSQRHTRIRGDRGNTGQNRFHFILHDILLFAKSRSNQPPMHNSCKRAIIKNATPRNISPPEVPLSDAPGSPQPQSTPGA